MNRISKRLASYLSGSRRYAQTAVEKITMSDGNIVLFEARTDNVFSLMRKRFSTYKFCALAVPGAIVYNYYNSLELKKMSVALSGLIDGTKQFRDEDIEGEELLIHAGWSLLILYVGAYFALKSLRLQFIHGFIIQVFPFQVTLKPHFSISSISYSQMINSEKEGVADYLSLMHCSILKRE